jgi:uncharacterized protein
MTIEKIDLGHQAMLEKAFSTLQAQDNLEISEYSFADLYLFRRVYEYAVWQNGELFIRGKTRDGHTFLMPTSRALLQSKSALEQAEADFFFPIPESWLAALGPEIKTSYMESESDYIYAVETLSHYPGRHLSKKRNLVKQFHELYGEMRAVPLDTSQQLAAKQLLDRWKGHVAGVVDYLACCEAIDLLEVLKLEGTVYYFESIPIGIIIGEVINNEMFVIHFAKADIEYKGVYQYMYQAFAASLEGRCKWINMEQDLGLSAIRQSKHSYEPVKLCKKYRLYK